MPIDERSTDASRPAVARELIRQMRAIDTFGTYDRAADAEILDPFVMTKERRREIPIVGDPDELTVARLKAFYNALSVLIEQRTGLMAVPLVHLHYEGFGRALVVVGKLVVADRILRDMHRFGFASLEKLESEALELVDSAVALVEAHPDVARL
ncbi:MAG: NifX-associated nitrogen fixation protein [Roseicyclus sp.]